ncbi:MAG: IS21-like element helper ATPase IstB, partial [Bacteroidales bacterium]|nr:IS21-like element helper ATPase IstB [Bacteroidales bacterium]
MEIEMNKDTLEKLKEMKLYGMFNTFKASLENYNRNNMTVDKFVNMLVCNEWDERYNRHVNHLIKSAGFRFPASIEEIDYSVERGLDKNLMERLADLSFIKEKKNIFITGSSGTGKTYIATALGNCACQKNYRVIYANTARLMGMLKASKASGKILRDLKRIQRTDLLILDDFALSPFDTVTRGLLMEVIDDRYDSGSTIVASQIPVDYWHESIGEQTVADA